MLVIDVNGFSIASVTDSSGIIINCNGNLMYNEGSSLSDILLATFCDPGSGNLPDVYTLHCYEDDIHLVNNDLRTISIFKEILVDEDTDNTYEDIVNAILEAELIPFDSFFNKKDEESTIEEKEDGVIEDNNEY